MIQDDIQDDVQDDIQEDIQDDIAQNYVRCIIAPFYIWYFSSIVVVKFLTLRVF